MLEHLRNVRLPDSGQPAWNGRNAVSQTYFDVSTGSALFLASPAYAIAELDIVFDMAGKKITLMSAPGLPGLQFVEFGDLRPAVAAAREFLAGESDTWEVFSLHGSEARLIGGLETPETVAGQEALKGRTDAVSQVSLRTNFVSVERTIREKFSLLASEWKRTRNKYSSGVDMFVHPAYQQIIGMGDRVLPLIFEELSRQLDHWFWALKAITQADPVPIEELGNLAAMRNRWIAWATEHGYQWQPNYTNTHNVPRNSLR